MPLAAANSKNTQPVRPFGVSSENHVPEKRGEGYRPGTLEVSRVFQNILIVWHTIQCCVCETRVLKSLPAYTRTPCRSVAYSVCFRRGYVKKGNFFYTLYGTKNYSIEFIQYFYSFSIKNNRLLNKKKCTVFNIQRMNAMYIF